MMSVRFTYCFYAPQPLRGGGILFLPCLFVCLSVCNFNVANNFVTFASTHFIFGMHVYLMETFNLIPNMPKSRSGVKVKIT